MSQLGLDTMWQKVRELKKIAHTGKIENWLMQEKRLKRPVVVDKLMHGKKPEIPLGKQPPKSLWQTTTPRKGLSADHLKIPQETYSMVLRDKPYLCPFPLRTTDQGSYTWGIFSTLLKAWYGKQLS